MIIFVILYYRDLRRLETAIILQMKFIIQQWNTITKRKRKMKIAKVNNTIISISFIYYNYYIFILMFNVISFFLSLSIASFLFNRM